MHVCALAFIFITNIVATTATVCRNYKHIEHMSTFRIHHKQKQKKKKEKHNACSLFNIPFWAGFVLLRIEVNSSVSLWCETIGHDWLIVENRVNVPDTKIVNYSWGSLYNTQSAIHSHSVLKAELCICAICNWSQVNSLCLRLLAQQHFIFDASTSIENLLHVSVYFAYQYNRDDRINTTTANKLHIWTVCILGSETRIHLITTSWYFTILTYMSII